MGNWFEQNIPQEVIDSSLLVFNVTLPNGNVVKFDIRKSFDIDMDTIEDELENVPAMIAYYGEAFSEMKYRVAVQEKKIKVRRARLLEKFSGEAKKDNIKLQVDVMKSMVESDQDLMKLELELATFQRDTGKLYSAIEALRAKHESLRSLAGFKKQHN